MLPPQKILRRKLMEENELDKKSVTEKCSLTADDGKKYNT